MAVLYRDPRWQKKRLEILERDEWACQLCFDDSTTLHVHHRYYDTGAAPWEYPGRALLTLCEGCHEAETEFLANAKAMFIKAALAHFTSFGLLILTEALKKMRDVPASFEEVRARAIARVIEDPALLEEITDSYFGSLKKEVEFGGGGR